jgi:ABC-type cobalamin/Fe3+-siderophores transport system ATPase subunit
MKPHENPFRAERIDSLAYRLEGETWESLLARLAALRFRAAIIGPHGSGKSTLLDSIAPHLRERGYILHRVRLSTSSRNLSSEQWRQLREFGEREILMLDGLEQLTFLQWQRLVRETRSAGGLIATSHRAGRLPTLWKCRTSAELLQRLIAELQQNCATPHTTSDAKVLFARHCGNVRDALRELYDHCSVQGN